MNAETLVCSLLNLLHREMLSEDLLCEMNEAVLLETCCIQELLEG